MFSLKKSFALCLTNCESETRLFTTVGRSMDMHGANGLIYGQII